MTTRLRQRWLLAVLVAGSLLGRLTAAVPAGRSAVRGEERVPARLGR